MKISDLDKMESIVKSNPSLKWEGWDVVFLEEDGWDIPDSILRKGDVQV